MRNFIFLIVIFITVYSLAAEEKQVFLESGMGSMVGAYFSREMFTGYYLGIGCGYLYYQEKEQNIHAVSPSLILHHSLDERLIIRARAGMDLIRETKKDSGVRTGFIAPDLLIRALSFSRSCIYAGVSINFVFGRAGSQLVPVAGAGYLMDF